MVVLSHLPPRALTIQWLTLAFPFPGPAAKRQMMGVIRQAGSGGQMVSSSVGHARIPSVLMRLAPYRAAVRSSTTCPTAAPWVPVGQWGTMGRAAASARCFSTGWMPLMMSISWPPTPPSRCLSSAIPPQGDSFSNLSPSLHRKLRKQLTATQFKKAARKPWRKLPVKTPFATPGRKEDFVVLD